MCIISLIHLLCKSIVQQCNSLRHSTGSQVCMIFVFIFLYCLLIFSNFIFSLGKYYIYYLKVEASYYPNRELCNWIKSDPGKTSDITIFRNNMAWHKRASKKSPLALTIRDNLEGYRNYLSYHAVLVDKGYIGITESLR